MKKMSSVNTKYACIYDDIGNRDVASERGTNRTYTANELNQYFLITNLTSDAGFQTSEFEPQYDDDGNQTLIQTSTGIWTVIYNGENRPVLWERTSSDTNTQTLISMSFDRMGRRVSYLEIFGSVTNSHKVFTYDGYLQIANSELTTQTSQLFIWDPTEPVATRPLVFYNSDASPQYYTHDGNKNVSGLTDSTQSLAAHYAYTPFGALLSSSGSSSPTNPFRFSSEHADDALGLVYYNYRHYNPEIGRWMRRDRIFDGQNAYNILNGDCVNDIDMLGERNHRQRILVRRQKKQWKKQIKRMPGAFKGVNPGDVVSLAIDTIAYFRDIDSAIDAGVRNCEKIAPTPLIHRHRQTGLSIISDPCRCCVVWMIVAKMGEDKYYFRYLSSSVEDSPCDKLYFMSKNNNSIWRGVPWY